MSEVTTGIRLLPGKGGKDLVFALPDELTNWCEKLKQDWRWLTNTPCQRTWHDLERFVNAIQATANNWQRQIDSEDIRSRAQQDAQHHYQELLNSAEGFFGDASATSFITELKQSNSGAAAGAFAVLTGCSIELNSNATESFFTGIVRGFLYKNEIEWAATSHRKTLVELESEYQSKIREQQERLGRLEGENQRLNEKYAAALTAQCQSLDTLRDEKAALLNDLHAAKDKVFGELAAKHEANLKNIEDTFHNKLALQKPIDYWKEKKATHVKLAKRFAWSSALVLVTFGIGLGRLIYWAFGSLGPNDNPKHWQFGVTIIAAFFAIWIVRLMVRMFLSHQHLAADAAERVTMVQTYLSLSREGQGVAPADRSVILQQLFKSASDGLVKDDGAPPNALEWFSRAK
jgi:hypothetical protein